jgi:putative colanic acid biosynthesis UDP-glucose lipid carrier transferase
MQPRPRKQIVREPRVRAQGQSIKEIYGSAVERSLTPHAAALHVAARRPRTVAVSDLFGPRSESARILKRALDLSVATVLFAILAPALALIAILIRLDSPGPAFFRQQRIGQGGRAFDIFKFRTMHVIENGSNVVQVRKDDARVTRIGRWLRRTSLDELPQLINVVLGEMSLVGPRPHATFHDRRYAALIENYSLRHSVKPGITGWAQVHGLRGPTPALKAMKSRVRYDIWYARHASFALDLIILFRTPREMLLQRNAY